MANNNATTSVDNITQTAANDTLTFTATNQVNATDVFDGAAGIDGLLLSGATGVAISFTAASLTAFKNYEQLIFGNSSGTTTATFNANQFGATLGNLPFALQLVATAGTNIMVINNASSFSAASFTFSSWTNGTDQVQINGTAGNDTITGSGQNDLLTGAAGNDTLNGGAGNDTMLGGLGDDIYVVDATTDVVTENAGEGTDTVQSSVTWTLGNDVEILTLTGAGAINGTGNALDNSITGNSGANTLSGGAGNDQIDGGAGNDTLVGGTGDDTYYVDSTSDVVTENASEGTDTVQASATFTLSANVENLVLTGVTAINGTGNASANTITGNSAANTLTGGAGNDTLDGGAGNDTMIGGTDNDTYVVDSGADVVTENVSEGTDTVLASVTYTLGANVENLTLTGVSAINGTGNGLDNVIVGNAAANTLSGGAGNDTLDGGAGNDAMSGGTGNDNYLVDSSSDTITENAGEGTDQVYSAVAYTLGANVENLTLTGSSSVNGTGSAVANVLIGNSGANTLTGGAGNDTLDGGTGADTLVGGADNDVYIVDNGSDVVTELAGEGTDHINSSVSYAMSANVENMVLSGSSAINAYGNSAANYIGGNTGNNYIDGGAGVDTMVGGAGDDTYVIDSASDVVTENAGEGSDTVQAAFTYSLGANIENITIIGTAAIDATGNSQDNVLTGNIASNTLTGGAGHDTLDGGAGNDIMIGGTGNDSYVIDSSSDIVTENAGEGTDTVYANMTFALGGNIENLVLMGSANLNGTGDASANVVYGNAGNNIIDGGAGADTMAGGAGNDTFYVDDAGDTVSENANEGTDTVISTQSYVLGANIENLVLVGASALTGVGNAQNNTITGNSFNNVLDGGAGDDTLIGGTGNDIYYIDSVNDAIVENVGEGTDTVNSYVSHTMGLFTEMLNLLGSANTSAVGNSFANTIYGNTGNNVINGGAGVDTLIGGLGDDTYVIDNANDVVTEYAGQGTDTVMSGVSVAALAANVENLVLTGTAKINGTGNADNNLLIGNIADNVLDGGLGNDAMYGGLGNDTYIVDSASDTVVEYTGEGTDTVLASFNYTVGANIENLTLTGSTATVGVGSVDNNTIVGNALNNSLYGLGGDDMLDGGAGADVLVGGIGDDTYVIDNAGDIIIEYAGEGSDTVMTATSYTVSGSIENITLTGTGLNTATGNDGDNVLKGNGVANTLIGLGGNDTLDGGLGIDTLIGGLGNDTYVVDNASDVVMEALGEGTDVVKSTVNYVLGANIENLTLIGTRSSAGTGNELNNIITGNGAGNTLDGGAGTDTLIGGGGNDTYIIDNLVDVIVEIENEGIDTVASTVTYTLADTLENLTLSGTAAVNGTGNTANNEITGNSNANTLIGLAGSDKLDGGAGIDTMIGGVGNDDYYVDSAYDVVTELLDEGIDQVFASASYALANHVEELTLTGATALTGYGNHLNNKITGNTGANILYGFGGDDVIDGGKGADQLYGGAGNDTYIVDLSTDSVTELAGEGTDLVKSTVTYVLGANLENLTLTGTSIIAGTGNGDANLITGNSVANSLYGMAGNDTLDGGFGADSMNGGTGDDSYVVDIVGDTVTEYAGEGTDIVYAAANFTLGGNIENLALTGGNDINGNGNTLDNILIGNIGDNILYGFAGNDTIDGGRGADTLYGGLGNDTYFVDNVGDVVVELAGEGFETVYASADHILGANVENLILQAVGGIDGTGNALNNTITGNRYDNILNGGAGADTMIGGDGDDTFIVDNTGDIITELTAEGTDSIESSVTIMMSSNVENLTLTGAAAINGTGNAEDNYMIGNDAANVMSGGIGDDTIEAGIGNDTLTGGLGIDFLTGGAGNDTFVFSALTDSSLQLDVNGDPYGSDQITDFTTGDKIDLSIIDANSAVAGNQAFILDTDGIVAAGEIHITTPVSGVYQLSIHTDADGVADMTIAVVANSSPVATDFIL